MLLIPENTASKLTTTFGKKHFKLAYERIISYDIDKTGLDGDGAVKINYMLTKREQKRLKALSNLLVIIIQFHSIDKTIKGIGGIVYSESGANYLDDIKSYRIEL